MPKKASNPDDEHTITITELPLVALRETVIFPEMIVPLQVGREKSVAALNAAVANGGPHRAGDPAPGGPGGHHRPVRAVRASGRSPRSPRSSSSRTAPSAPSSRARPACACTASSQTESVHPRPHRGARPTSRSTGVEVQALMRSVQSADRAVRRQTGAPVPPEAAVAARNITEPGPARRHGRLQPRT